MNIDNVYMSFGVTDVLGYYIEGEGFFAGNTIVFSDSSNEQIEFDHNKTIEVTLFFDFKDNSLVHVAITKLTKNKNDVSEFQFFPKHWQTYEIENAFETIISYARIQLNDLDQEMFWKACEKIKIIIDKSIFEVFGE